MAGYKINNQNALHYLTLTTVGWIDVFTRQRYRDIILDSLAYCQREKGLILHAYVVMSNHLHLIAQADEPKRLSDILRDFKKYTSAMIIRSMQEEAEHYRYSSATNYAGGKGLLEVSVIDIAPTIGYVHLGNLE